MSALAQQQYGHQPQFVPPQPRSTTLFIGSISGGITDAFLNQLLSVSKRPAPVASPNINFTRRHVAW